MTKKDSIFVNIAAYRDMETYATVRDLFEKAKSPENLHVSICWQYNSLREEPFTISDRKHQVSVINIDYKKSQGCSWARHVAQETYNGETYYLQVDAHSRFIPHWDAVMIDELARCNSNKPILSTYPNQYTLPDTIIDHGPYKLIFDKFNKGIPTFHSRACNENEKANPTPSLVIGGGLIFSYAEAILDVPYDPHLYFVGDEIAMSVRYWTHGYDIFTPTRSMVFHLYVEPGLVKNYNWSDNPDWHDNYERSSCARVLHLLGVEQTTDRRALRNLNRYGLGNIRSLQQYETFAGINFKAQTLSDNAKNGIPSV